MKNNLFIDHDPWSQDTNTVLFLSALFVKAYKLIWTGVWPKQANAGASKNRRRK